MVCADIPTVVYSVLQYENIHAETEYRSFAHCLRMKDKTAKRALWFMLEFGVCVGVILPAWVVVNKRGLCRSLALCLCKFRSLINEICTSKCKLIPRVEV